jgi:hypothetical protein
VAISLSSRQLSTGGLEIQGKLVNDRQLLRKLANYDKEVATQVRADIKQLAAPLEGRARSIASTREPPLSNWGETWGRLKWTSQSASSYKVLLGRSGIRRQSGEKIIPLLVFKSKNPAGSVYDWAGRKNPDNRLAFSLERVGLGFDYMKGAKYSRVLFPAYVAEKRSVIRNINRSLDKVARRLNRELGN